MSEQSSDAELVTRATLLEAAEFLASHSWFVRVTKSHLVLELTPMLSLVRAEVEVKSSATAEMWVIIGDLPPAYIDRGICRTPLDAFMGYVGELEAWADAATQGQSLSEYMPVCYRASSKELPVTRDIIERIRNLCKSIELHLLPLFRGDGEWDDRIQRRDVALRLIRSAYGE